MSGAWEWIVGCGSNLFSSIPAFMISVWPTMHYTFIIHEGLGSMLSIICIATSAHARRTQLRYCANCLCQSYLPVVWIITQVRNRNKNSTPD